MQDKENQRIPFGVAGDYMTSGIERLNHQADTPLKETIHPRLPRENPPTPWDDRKGAGMSLGELAKDELEKMIDDKK